PAMLALRLVLAACHLGSAGAMHAFVKRWLGSNRAAFAAALLYLLVPPRFHAVLRLGRLPEAMNFLFLPLLLWAIEGFVRRPRLREAAVCALVAAGFVL